LMAPTATEVARSGTSSDEIMERLRMGYHSAFSGDVLVVPEPGWIQYGPSGTDHGSPFPYDTHVPCIFYGWHIPTGITYDRTNIRDIAPTVAGLIHTPLPNASTGRPIQAVMGHE
jgi:arylsulfatase A-like enzyme